MDEIGVVVSPSGMNVFELVLTERAGLTRGDYCVFKHPVNGTLCLARIFAGSAKNPEMFSLSFGALLAKRGIKMGKEQEVVVLKAEALGYMDANRSFNRMDFPPSPGSTVHRADETLIKYFLKYQRGLQIDVGLDPYSGIPIQLSLDLLTKGHASICGMTRSGKSIDGNEEVFIIKGGIPKRVKIKDLEDEVDYKTVCFDENHKVKMRTVTAFHKHEVGGKLYRLTTKTGRRVVITGDHSVFKVQDFEIKPTPVDKLKVGDYIAVPERLPSINNDLDEVNLIRLISGSSSNFRVSGEGVYRCLNEAARNMKKTEIMKRIGGKYCFWNLIHDGGSVPLDKFLRFVEEENLTFDLKSTFLGVYGSKNNIPALIPVDIDLIKFLGYFISEGTFEESGISFINSNEHILDEIKEAVKHLFYLTPFERKMGNLTRLTYCSIPLRKILQYAFGIKPKNKRIPDFIYGLSDEKICEFLRSLFSGDGSVTVNLHKSSYNISYYTKSEKLAEDVLYLLLTQGIIAYLHTNERRDRREVEHQVRIYYPYTIRFFKKVRFLQNEKNTKIEEMLFVRKNPHSRNNFIPYQRSVIKQFLNKEFFTKEIWRRFIRNYRHQYSKISKRTLKRICEFLDNPLLKRMAESDIFFDQVKKLERVEPSTPFVYDLSVNPTENFLGGFGGIFLHNTSFVMSLIEACSTQEPAGKFLVFDRYGEYNPLVATGVARVLDYRELQSLQSLRGETLASMFGLTTGRAPGRFLATAIRDIIQYGGEINRENILSLAEKHVKRDRSRILGEIEISLNRHRENLEKLMNMSYESPSVVRLLTEEPVIIIDLSTDPDIRGQQTVLTSVLEELFAAATASRGEEFTCLVVVEEAQFYAPEKGAPTFGDPFGTKSLDMLAACCSQLGGYNVGFMIMTQRPAYVSKALLAQCNTHLVFRLMSGADHDQIASVTGYPKNRISELVSGLKDHRALIVGMAAPFEFPVFIETNVRRYPQKATITASEVLEKIETVPQLKSRL